MSPEQAPRPLTVENTKVFEYRREVIVELHGRTPDGEFGAVSYVFRNEPADEAGLRPPEIADTHEDVVREVLAETDYTLARVSP